MFGNPEIPLAPLNKGGTRSTQSPPLIKGDLGGSRLGYNIKTGLLLLTYNYSRKELEDAIDEHLAQLPGGEDGNLEIQKWLCFGSKTI